MIASSTTLMSGILGFIVWIGSVVLAFWLGVKKNRPLLGLLLGLFLTVIGVGIMALVRPKEGQLPRIA